MASGSTTQNDERRLCDIFDEGFKLFNSFDKCQDPTNSSTVQSNIKKCMRLLEDATRLVSATDMFSTNEGVDEIPTEHLRYFLLPVLLGELSLKLCSGERTDIVKVAEIYLNDFLKRCREYGLAEENTERSVVAAVSGNDQVAQLAAMVGTRNAKLQRFKEQKLLDEQLAVLQVAMDNDHADEEIRRNFFLTTIKMFVMKTVDDLKSLEMEKQLLEHMQQLKEDEPEDPNKPPKRRGPPPQPLKPVIITRDEVQKAVYGMGYPSLPTYTVQEFYDQRVREGLFPDPNKPKSANAPKSLQNMTEEDHELQSNLQDEEDEKKEEADNPEDLERARAMDEYKDEHRRGWGNRHNRS